MKKKKIMHITYKDFEKPVSSNSIRIGPFLINILTLKYVLHFRSIQCMPIIISIIA